ncbi:MAG TPA: DegT/DnrJ/EryC1/StrS family aminotransferase [Fibrobacteria bacterium]|nr:DegT/DnrJ/EryC1/StrS family aminotransferase [Fibrobacteria bacterium]
MNPVPFFDLSRQHAAMGKCLTEPVATLLASGSCVLGPVVESLEEDIAVRCGARWGIGLSSGTDSLLATLAALGIGLGDEVVTTPFSFVATAQAVARTGARPVFADIDDATMDMDPRAAEAACGPRTKAILPVHLFGLVAEMDVFEEIARSRELALVEDAAQAFAASRLGRMAGSWGTAGCHSFYPTKVLGAGGDAGAVTTSDPDLAERVSRLRAHGEAPDGLHREMGGNFRMDAVQAAILAAKLPLLEGFLSARRGHATAYLEALAGTDSVLPSEDPHGRRVWSQFCIRHPRRDDLRAHLSSRGIGTGVYYRLPLHLEPCFSHLGDRVGDFPNAERAAREILALPIFPELRTDERDRVIEAVLEFEGGAT